MRPIFYSSKARDGDDDEKCGFLSLFLSKVLFLSLSLSITTN
jgi:hypothetical protein